MLKTLIKKIDNSGTIKRLPGSGRTQRTNMHLSRRSYLIILLTEVKSYVVVSTTLCCGESVAVLHG